MTPLHVRFALYDLGILPREVHVKSGLVQINIEDYTGGGSALVVERKEGGSTFNVGQVQLDLQRPRGEQQMNLGPGEYQVFMPDRPDNRALLVVE
jgi:hypothetical protein